MGNNAEEDLHVFSLAKNERSPEKVKGSTYKPKSGASKNNSYSQTHHR